MEPDDSLLDWPAVHSRVEHGSGLDRTGSGLKPIFAGSGLDRTAIFLKIGGSGLDRTEKILVILMWLFWKYQNFYLWSNFTDLLNRSLYFAIKGKNPAGTILHFELYPLLFTYNVEVYSCSNVNIVECLVSMRAVRFFVGSALTISFGLTCRGYTFDRNAFNVLFQKVQGLGLRFMFSVYV